jgi:hypothetical protein
LRGFGASDFDGAQEWQADLWRVQVADQEGGKGPAFTGGNPKIAGAFLVTEYDKAVMQELRDHIEYRKRKPLIWLTKREVSEILVANGHWQIEEKRFKEIYREIQKKVTQINQIHQEPQGATT